MHFGHLGVPKGGKESFALANELYTWNDRSLKMTTERADILREKVHEAYSRAARDPVGQHPFPLGRAFAEGLGYSADALAELPLVVLEAFTGVSNVSEFAEISPDSLVLDLGCGAGLDSLIAARRAASGFVLGIDFSEPMLDRARYGAEQTRLSNVRFCRAAAESLPLPNAVVDTVLVNGIFNLNPARQQIMRELGRVVRPVGSVYAAELVLREPLPTGRSTDGDWFA